MIGFWNYTVLLTYLSLASSVCGMVFAFDGKIMSALACLAFSGLCDAFDGRVARSKKDRTDSEKMFGIQLDSLCDVVGFGFLPGIICYKLGLQSPVGVALIIFYCIASVARLAYYNMLEIDFDAMAAEEKNSNVKALDEYFSTAQATKKNDYTYLDLPLYKFNKGFINVSNSEQLFYALANKYYPIPISGSSAEKLFNKMISIFYIIVPSLSMNE